MADQLYCVWRSNEGAPQDGDNENTFEKQELSLTPEQVTALFEEWPWLPAHTREVSLDDELYQVFQLLPAPYTGHSTAVRLKTCASAFRAHARASDDEKRWRTVAYALSHAEAHGAPLLAIRATAAAAKLDEALVTWRFTPEIVQQLAAGGCLLEVSQTVRACLAIIVAEGCEHFGKEAIDFVYSWHRLAAPPAV